MKFNYESAFNALSTIKIGDWNELILSPIIYSFLPSTISCIHTMDKDMEYVIRKNNETNSYCIDMYSHLKIINVTKSARKSKVNLITRMQGEIMKYIRAYKSSPDYRKGEILVICYTEDLEKYIRCIKNISSVDSKYEAPVSSPLSISHFVGVENLGDKDAVLCKITSKISGDYSNVSRIYSVIPVGSLEIHMDENKELGLPESDVLKDIYTQVSIINSKEWADFMFDNKEEEEDSSDSPLATLMEKINSVEEEEGIDDEDEDENSSRGPLDELIAAAIKSAYSGKIVMPSKDGESGINEDGVYLFSKADVEGIDELLLTFISYTNIFDWKIVSPSSFNKTKGMDCGIEAKLNDMTFVICCMNIGNGDKIYGYGLVDKKSNDIISFRTCNSKNLANYTLCRLQLKRVADFSSKEKEFLQLYM